MLFVDMVKNIKAPKLEKDLKLVNVLELGKMDELNLTYDLNVSN